MNTKILHNCNDDASKILFCEERAHLNVEMYGQLFNLHTCADCGTDNSERLMRAIIISDLCLVVDQKLSKTAKETKLIGEVKIADLQEKLENHLLDLLDFKDNIKAEHKLEIADLNANLNSTRRECLKTVTDMQNKSGAAALYHQERALLDEFKLGLYENVKNIVEEQYVPNFDKVGDDDLPLKSYSDLFLILVQNNIVAKGKQTDLKQDLDLAVNLAAGKRVQQQQENEVNQQAMVDKKNDPSNFVVDGEGWADGFRDFRESSSRILQITGYENVFFWPDRLIRIYLTICGDRATLNQVKASLGPHVDEKRIERLHPNWNEVESYSRHILAPGTSHAKGLHPNVIRAHAACRGLNFRIEMKQCLKMLMWRISPYRYRPLVVSTENNTFKNSMLEITEAKKETENYNDSKSRGSKAKVEVSSWHLHPLLKGDALADILKYIPIVQGQGTCTIMLENVAANVFPLDLNSLIDAVSTTFSIPCESFRFTSTNLSRILPKMTKFTRGAVASVYKFVDAKNSFNMQTDHLIYKSIVEEYRFESSWMQSHNMCLNLQGLEVIVNTSVPYFTKTYYSVTPMAVSNKGDCAVTIHLIQSFIEGLTLMEIKKKGLEISQHMKQCAEAIDKWNTINNIAIVDCNPENFIWCGTLNMGHWLAFDIGCIALKNTYTHIYKLSDLLTSGLLDIEAASKTLQVVTKLASSILTTYSSVAAEQKPASIQERVKINTIVGKLGFSSKKYKTKCDCRDKKRMEDCGGLCKMTEDLNCLCRACSAQLKKVGCLCREENNLMTKADCGGTCSQCENYCKECYEDESYMPCVCTCLACKSRIHSSRFNRTIILKNAKVVDRPVNKVFVTGDNRYGKEKFVQQSSITSESIREEIKKKKVYVEDTKKGGERLEESEFKPTVSKQEIELLSGFPSLPKADSKTNRATGSFGNNRRDAMEGVQKVVDQEELFKIKDSKYTLLIQREPIDDNDKLALERIWDNEGEIARGLSASAMTKIEYKYYITCLHKYLEKKDVSVGAYKEDNAAKERKALEKMYCLKYGDKFEITNCKLITYDLVADNRDYKSLGDMIRATKEFAMANKVRPVYGVEAFDEIWKECLPLACGVQFFEDFYRSVVDIDALEFICQCSCSIQHPSLRCQKRTHFSSAFDFTIMVSRYVLGESLCKDCELSCMRDNRFTMKVGRYKIAIAVNFRIKQDYKYDAQKRKLSNRRENPFYCYSDKIVEADLFDPALEDEDFTDFVNAYPAKDKLDSVKYQLAIENKKSSLILNRYLPLYAHHGSKLAYLLDKFGPMKLMYSSTGLISECKYFAKVDKDMHKLRKDAGECYCDTPPNVDYYSQAWYEPHCSVQKMMYNYDFNAMIPDEEDFTEKKADLLRFNEEYVNITDGNKIQERAKKYCEITRIYAEIFHVVKRSNIMSVGLNAMIRKVANKAEKTWPDI